MELELANVNEIDGRVHGKTKTRKTVWKFEDLPLPAAADVKLFKKNVVLPVLDWAATLENHFSANSHSELKATVTRLWTGTFAHLPKYLDDAKKELHVEHPAIMGIVHQIVLVFISWLTSVRFKQESAHIIAKSGRLPCQLYLAIGSTQSSRDARQSSNERHGSETWPRISGLCMKSQRTRCVVFNMLL